MEELRRLPSLCRETGALAKSAAHARLPAASAPPGHHAGRSLADGVAQRVLTSFLYLAEFLYLVECKRCHKIICLCVPGVGGAGERQSCVRPPGRGAAPPLHHAGGSLADGVAQRVLVRPRPGAQVYDALAEVMAARGGDCSGIKLLPLAPRFGIERIEVRVTDGEAVNPSSTPDARKRTLLASPQLATLALNASLTRKRTRVRPRARGELAAAITAHRGVENAHLDCLLVTQRGVASCGFTTSEAGR